MHGHHSSEDEPMAEMNLIPLIDIALTLLIILMVTSAFIHRPGVSLKLPQTATREGMPETSKDLTITVTPDGVYHVDGKIETAPVLKQQMVELAGRDKEARILIKGDRDVAYARIMDVMDIVRQAGLSHVVLPTDPKATQAAAIPAETGVPGTAPVTPPTQNSSATGVPGGASVTPPTQNSSDPGVPGTAPVTPPTQNR